MYLITIQCHCNIGMKLDELKMKKISVLTIYGGLDILLTLFCQVLGFRVAGLVSSLVICHLFLLLVVILQMIIFSY